MTLDEIHHNIFVNTIYRLTDIQKLLHATCRMLFSSKPMQHIILSYPVCSKEEREGDSDNMWRRLYNLMNNRMRFKGSNLLLN